MQTIWMLQALHSRHAKLHATRDPMVTRVATHRGSALDLQFCNNRGTTQPTLVCATPKTARRSFQLRLQKSVETREYKSAISLPVASNGVEERNARWRKELGQKCGIQNERESEDTDDDERDAPAEKLLRCYKRPPR